MSPRGTPPEGSRKLDNLKGTFLEPRTLHVETEANKWVIIITSTLFAALIDRRCREWGVCVCEFIFRTSIHVLISFILFCVFHFKWCIHWSSAIIPKGFFFFFFFLFSSFMIWKVYFFSFFKKIKFLPFNFQERALAWVWTTGSAGVHTSLASFREASARNLFLCEAEEFPGKEKCVFSTVITFLASFSSISFLLHSREFLQLISSLFHDLIFTYPFCSFFLYEIWNLILRLHF